MHIISSSAYLLGASGEVLDRNRAPPHTANRTSRITMTQPSTAPTTVVAVMFAHVPLMMNISVGVSKSSDLIEAHLISIVNYYSTSRPCIVSRYTAVIGRIWKEITHNVTNFRSSIAH